ncbi:hypothetical protein ACJW30_01G070300 [Castanea mollissima]
MEEIQSERNSAKQDYYIITCVINSLITCQLPLQLMLCTKADTLLGDFLFCLCRSILSSATCSKIIVHKNPKWKRKKTRKDKELFHTLLAMCRKISKIWENSGLKDGSCCQHLSSNSPSFGGVCLGIVGLRP